MPTFTDRRHVLALLAASPALFPTLAHSQETPKMTTSMTTGSPIDFDFLIGSWRVKHRRLKERLAGNNDWEEFAGTCAMQPLMQGLGNVDDNWLDIPSGAYRAVGLRSFNPATKQWAIWWLDGRDPHTIEAPVKGGFQNGVGTFLAEDTLRGQPILARFQWSAITATTAEWRQAFSPDGGETWETNWEMWFAREA